MKTGGWLIASAAVFVVDQVAKYLLPVVLATDRLSLFVRVIAIGVLITSYFRRCDRRVGPLLALVLGAGLGNVYDILVFGQVRDVFLVGTLAFNVADVVLVGGMLLFVSFILRRPAV
ncbi:MAG: signal peptidase II [Candidatus Andersenbacteria bacterium]|nr:signal peptidase II [Candidatus Andersenbacteria bacterium]MBI3250648.1 signal peptidase II [Candidatus Andersenbacteria bacterium]